MIFSREPRSINWGMVIALAGTAAFWAGLGWAIWRATH